MLAPLPKIRRSSSGAAGRLQAPADHIHRLFNHSEQADKRGAGENHHRHKEKQHNDDTGAHPLPPEAAEGLKPASTPPLVPAFWV